MQRRETVSFETEQLILVNSADEPVGFASKAGAHDGDGVLHRAFSLFIFNPRGELLLQQRAPEKRLWPGYWSNSCCSHPRAGERMDEAIHRRLKQELGIAAELTFLYKFEYHAQYDEEGSEHELCWVYIGCTDDEVAANASEISAWRFVEPAALDEEMRTCPDRFTPWFKLEWTRIREQFQAELAACMP